MPGFRPSRTAVVLALSALVGAGIAGCRRGEQSAATPEDGWPLRGEIVALVPERSAITISHEEIKSYMPAMTMELKVNANDLSILKAGQHVRGRLVQSGTDFYLEQIWPDDEGGRRTIEAAARALKEDTRIRANEAYREVGETSPEFALYDQEGRVVQFGAFRGKRVVLNFIFTRCPIPTMCPAATLRMQALQKAAKSEGIENLELVSITLDPTFDTPAVLKGYAESRGIDLSNFRFLTGPEGAVKDLLTQFGVVIQPGEGVVKHSLATLLIDEHGKIVHREDGATWQTESFLVRLRKRGGP